MELVKHETCIEYLKRRLSEGWRCIEWSPPYAVLLSPEGSRREIDLRKDVLTLVPNGAGDYTNIPFQVPSSGEHWDKVDDPPASPDDNATNVYISSTTQQKDAYNLQNTSQTGTINSVRVYFRIAWSGP